MDWEGTGSFRAVPDVRRSDCLVRIIGVAPAFLLRNLAREFVSFMQDGAFRRSVVEGTPGDRFEDLFRRPLRIERLEESGRPLFRLSDDPIDARLRFIHDGFAERQIGLLVISALPAVFLAVGPFDDLVPKLRGDAAIRFLHVLPVFHDRVPVFRIHLQSKNDILEKRGDVPFGDAELPEPRHFG